MLGALIELNKVDSDRATALALSIPATHYTASDLITALKHEGSFEGRTILREILSNHFMDKLTFEVLVDLQQVEHDDVQSWVWQLLEALYEDRLTLEQLFSFLINCNEEVVLSVHRVAMDLSHDELDYNALMKKLGSSYPRVRELASKLVSVMMAEDRAGEMEQAFRSHFRV